jgi:hypothetical protein
MTLKVLKYRFLLAVAAVVLLIAGDAGAFELKPFKDRLFSYPSILQSADGGDYRIVDYKELRDINGRDQVPELRVSRKYVDLTPRRRQSEFRIATPAGELRYFAVGQTARARIVTVYVHGRGGDRKQGVNDYSFGGNFNRIKNLMVRNGGLYLSPDAGPMNDASAARIRTLILDALRQSPAARLVIACGSAGGVICHALAKEPALAANLSGIAFLGSFGEQGFFTSAAYRAGVPLFIAHGSGDSVIPVEQAEAFYRAARKAPGHPARMVRFETGSHGTPIRMTDWRDMINWMLNAR